MKKLQLLTLFITMTSLLAATLPAWAQNSTGLVLRLSRDFGYSNGRGDIQGAFSMRVTGPENLTRVVYYIDEEAIGEATEAPYRFRFSTDNYPLGVHTMHAVGYTADGQELRSNEVRGNFVSASEGWQTAGRIVIPLLGLILVAFLVSVIIPIVTSGGKLSQLPPGTPRKYGVSGGAICPRCERPFALHFFGMNIGFRSKFDRCPYCGKWAVMRQRSMSELKAAEAAELQRAQGAGQVPTLSEEEKMRKELDESRYQSL